MKVIQSMIRGCPIFHGGQSHHNKREVLIPVIDIFCKIGPDHLQYNFVKHSWMAVPRWVIWNCFCFSALQKAWNKSLWKFRPWSLWTDKAEPNVVIKCFKNAVAVNSAFWEGEAANSTHFVNWTTMTKIYWDRELLFVNGPIISRCTLSTG